FFGLGGGQGRFAASGALAQGLDFGQDGQRQGGQAALRRVIGGVDVRLIRGQQGGRVLVCDQKGQGGIGLGRLCVGGNIAVRRARAALDLLLLRLQVRGEGAVARLRGSAGVDGGVLAGGACRRDNQEGGRGHVRRLFNRLTGCGGTGARRSRRWRAAPSGVVCVAVPAGDGRSGFRRRSGAAGAHATPGVLARSCLPASG